VDQKVWFTVYGEDGGVYEGTVRKADANTVTVHWSGGTHTVPRNGDPGHAPGAGEDESAAVAEIDEDFPVDGYPQMTTMKKLSDAELNHNLKFLHSVDRQFCYCGPTLVAINLFKIKDKQGKYFPTFTWERVQEYCGNTPERPHSYAFVEAAFQNVMSGGGNQAIVITGESGAGKSFCTNRMLDYLASVGKRPDDPLPNWFLKQAGEPEVAEPVTVTQRLVASTAILEAFGNAKMPRNNDSSRFGKLYQIYFDTNERIITGASIQPYLLEKSRITAQARDERNYHIFYELIRGLNDDEKAQMKLESDSNKGLRHYRWLNIPAYDVPKGKPPAWGNVTYNVPDDESPSGQKDDAGELEGVRVALKKFCSGDENNIFRSTMGVLTLGNIEIGDSREEKENIKESDPALIAAAELFGVESGALRQAIGFQTLDRVGTVPVSGTLARKFLSSIAKAIYNYQFIWMIKQVSMELSQDLPKGPDDCPEQPFIGVLDIFGFEYLNNNKLLASTEAVNSFEQWCINGCNEKLQALFVSIVVDLEEALYKEELGFSPELVFPRNDNTVDLIFGRTNSVYSKLENTCKMAARDTTDKGGTRDEEFLSAIRLDCMKKSNSWMDFSVTDGGPKLNRLDTKNKFVTKEYVKKKPDSAGAFMVDHYAAKVVYDVGGWTDKNADKITADMMTCFSSSSMDSGNGPGSGWLPSVYNEGQGKAGPGSVIAQFKNDLNNLVALLGGQNGGCETSFVRCIKPNSLKVADKYEDSLVLTQLAYTGMLQTLRIQKAGFPIRLKHQDYVDIFRVLDPDAAKEGVDALVKSINTNLMPDIIENLPNKEEIEPQLQHEGKPIDAIIVGKVAKVLSRDWAHTQVEIKAKAIKGIKAQIIQSVYRASDSKKEYDGKREAMNVLMPSFRGVLARLTYYPMKYAKMEQMSRASMVTMVRASMARANYYKERATAMEGANRQLLIKHINAAVYRQWYYERKVKFMLKEVCDRERARMKQYDYFGTQYIEEWAEERGAEEEERRTAAKEDDYRHEYEMAKEGEAFGRDKERALFEAEEYYREASAATHHLRKTLQEHKHKEFVLQENSAAIQRVATKKCREVLINMGVIKDNESTYTAPKLPEFPDEYDDDAMTAYLAAHKQKMLRKKVSPASIELETNVDISQLTGVAKARFIRNIAQQMGVDPSQVKIVLGLETPRY